MAGSDAAEPTMQAAMVALAEDLTAWRTAHPHATLAEIETVVRERTLAVAAHAVAGLAQASGTATVSAQPVLARPMCAACGTRLVPQGRHARDLILEGNHPVRLEREYAVCPTRGVGLFPLDDELGLLPGRYSPRVREGVVRLATHLPFRQAVRECGWFLGVAPAEATARRLTEAAGAAQVACQEAGRTVVERTLPPGPPGPALQQVSVDGAMVPLVGGQWAEVKTVAVGTVLGTRTSTTGERSVQTADWSYFFRLADAETFARDAVVELQHRGTFTAGTVVAPVDGSTWCQTFFDLHRPDAVRILDFPHAAEHLSAPARAVWGQGSVATQTWLDLWLPKLKTGATADVLEALCTLPVQEAGDPATATAVRAEAIAPDTIWPPAGTRCSTGSSWRPGIRSAVAAWSVRTSWWWRCG